MISSTRRSNAGGETAADELVRRRKRTPGYPLSGSRATGGPFGGHISVGRSLRLDRVKSISPCLTGFRYLGARQTVEDEADGPPPYSTTHPDSWLIQDGNGARESE